MSGLQQMVLAIVTLLILIYRRNGILSWWELDEWARKARQRFALRRPPARRPHRRR